MERAPRIGDDYELAGELGRGGMGTVYRARELSSGRQVAVKLLRDVSLRPDRLARFRREGELTAGLRHPGILRVHSAGESDGAPYLVYELVEDCRTLDQVKDDYDLEGRVRLLRDAARALGYAHARGVVHRDVKPENLLVDGDGRLRVADFGLALASQCDRLTRTGIVVGTPAFMAPEQADGRRDAVGPPTDVWALGATLYLLLTDQLPFDGASLPELMCQIKLDDPVPPRDHDPSIPRDLEAICLKALRRDPRGRHADGEAFARDLDRVLRDEPVEVGAYTPSGAGRRVALALGAVASLAVAAGAVAAAITHEAPRPSAPPARSPRAARPAPSQPASPAPSSAPVARTTPSRAGFRVTFAPVDFSRPIPGEDLPVTVMRVSAEQGDAGSMYALYKLIRDGKTEASPSLALSVLHAAAQGGDLGAQVSLSRALADGEGVEVDEVQAAHWCRKAAESGSVWAMRALAVRYRDGRGVPRDPEAARAHALLAIAGGDEAARDVLNSLDGSELPE